MRRDDLIQVSPSAYQVFYKKLNNKFYEECFKDKGVENTRSIWIEIDPSTNKPYAEKFLANSTITDTQYFFRKYIEYDPFNSVQNGIINAQVFLNTLIYLGIQPIEKVDNFDNLSVQEKAKHLYNSFIEINSKEISD